MPATTSTLTSVVIALPSGVGVGTPGLGTVSPSTIAGGSLGVSGSTVTYTFTAATVQAGRVLSISLTGLTNPSVPFLSLSTVSSVTISTRNGTTTPASTVDTGSASFTFALAVTAGSASWSVSSSMVGAANTVYTFGFSLGLALLTTTITMTVPPGTTGTPAVGSTSPTSLLSGVAGVTLSGNTLTVAFSGLGVALSVGTSYSIVINGLTNTPTAGSYQSEIVATSLLSVQSGISPAVNFPSGLWVGPPASLSWSGSLTGQSQSLPDTRAADQLLTVNDQTNTAAGWGVAVSATNFTTSGGATLTSSGVLGVNGNTSSLFTSTAPTAACQASTTCTLPDTSTVSYPVIISSGVAAAKIYSAKAGTGVGPVSVGGSSAANPVGWWVNLPALFVAGTYTSTITVSISSGP